MYTIGLLGLAGLLSADYAYGFGRNGSLFGGFFARNNGRYAYRERGRFNNEEAGPQVQQVQYQGRRGVSPYPEDNGLCRNCPTCPNGNCYRGQGQTTVGWEPQVAQVEYLPNTYEYIPPVDPGYGNEIRFDRLRNLRPYMPVDPAYGVENRIERDRLAIWYRNQGIDGRRAYWYRNRDEGNLDPGEAYYLRNRDDRDYRRLAWYANQDRDLARYALISDEERAIRRGDLCDSFGLPIPDVRGRIDNLDARMLALEARGDRTALLERDLENGMVAILRDRDGREIRRTHFGTRCPLCISLSPELGR
jgi:hypothetical protein